MEEVEEVVGVEEPLVEFPLQLMEATRVPWNRRHPVQLSNLKPSGSVSL
jgi:hypothetical protein